MNDPAYNPFSLAGGVYLVTGAASGIGRATSIVLSKLGASLMMVDIDGEGLRETHGLCSPTDMMLELDVTKSSILAERLTEAVGEIGRLHGFVHFAGKPYIAPLRDVSEERCAEIYALNTYAAIELAKLFTSRRIYAGERGSIVLVSSVYGLVGSAANVGYAMSKAALHGITKSLSIELARKGIRVNCIAPGFVKTMLLPDEEDMFGANHAEIVDGLHPLGMGEPEDVAYAVAYLLSDAAKWVTGSIFSVDGGFTAQ